MDATVPPPRTAPARAAAALRPLEHRHSVWTRLSHWAFFVAFLVLVPSGLQIFNASPRLDASDKSDAARRVLSIDAVQGPDGKPVGQVHLLGATLRTTHFLGYGDDGMGSEDERAFPAWLTLPGYQDLAGGRRWHLFFAWIMVVAGLMYLCAGFARRELRLIVLRPSDLPKLLPMQLYYLRLRKEPPPHGKYNPLQKAAYTSVLFVFAPLMVLSGFALSPGVDALLHPITVLLGGRQFARLWHFVATLALVGFFGVHLVLVTSTGLYNNMRSMITGNYRRDIHEGEGP